MHRNRCQPVRNQKIFGASIVGHSKHRAAVQRSARNIFEALVCRSPACTAHNAGEERFARTKDETLVAAQILFVDLKKLTRRRYHTLSRL